MKADVLSPSAIDTYLQCPEKYRHRYDEFTTPRPSYNAHVGSCFHNAMEAFADSKFQNSFEESMNWALAYKEAYPPKVVKEAMNIAEHWLAHNPLPSPNKIFGSEITFAPPGKKIRGRTPHSSLRFDSGLQIHGIIDIIWVDNDTVVVGDYKTQKSWITKDDLATKTQAHVYALAVHKITQRPVRVEFYMVRYPEDGPITWVPEEIDFEHIEKNLIAIQTRIKQDKYPVQARPSDICRWCEYNYTCPAYRNFVGKPTPGNGLWETMTLEEKISELDAWYDRYLACKGAVDSLKEMVQTEMEISNVDQIMVPTDQSRHWRITRRGQIEYASEVDHIVQKYGGANKLPPDVRAQLELYKKRSYSRPFLQRGKS